MNSILWYDYETSGIDTRNDRVLQFAGLRTDEDLNEVEAPVSFYCRPAGDCLPSPDACLVTGITPQHALREGLAEAEAMERIFAEFSRPRTCVAGYNNLRFDDEFTRFGFYRNFFDPYEREWRNGNSRWDLLDVMRAAWLLRPAGIQWPEHEPGVPSFRLEDLTKANAIEHTEAHDALADVRATIAMARLLKQAQPRFYDWVYGLRKKTAVQEFMRQQQRRGEALLHVSGKFPAAHGKASLVWPVARHPKNGNSVIVFDLRADPAALVQLSGEEIARLVFSRQEELAPGEQRLPLKEVHINRCPMLLHAGAVDETVAERMHIDLDQCARHAEWLRGAGDLQDRLGPVYQREFAPASDPDLQLYDGFLPDDDRQRMVNFRAAPPAERTPERWQFRDPRLQQLLRRYRARNWPELLAPDERAEWDAWRAARLQDETNPNGLGACLARIAELRAEGQDAEGARVLDELEAYARGLLATCG